MKKFDLDPTEGPHAASRLSDRELEFLQQIVAIEMAIRLEKSAYQDRFEKIAEARDEMDEVVCDLRRQRDRMIFVASVEADIDQIPVVEESQDEAHGLYL